MNSNTTTELNEMARNKDGSVNPDGLHRVQELAWGIIGESGRRSFFEFKGRQSCIKAAQAKPLPGPAGQAFASGPIKAAGMVVHKIVPAHFAVLQAMKSPLLTMIENAMTQKAVDVDLKGSEEWDICYLFTSDIEAVYNKLENEGVIAIQADAKKIGFQWDSAAIKLVIVAVLEQVKRHISTTVRFAADMDKDGQISFFREQSPTPLKPQA